MPSAVEERRTATPEKEKLQKKYTPQILSRIEGEYQTLPFVGRDIRQIKKEREA